MTEDLAKLLATPPQPTVAPFRPPAAWTPRREVGLEDATIVSEPRKSEGGARDQESLIREAGLDPADWEVAGYRSGEWQSPSGEYLESYKLDLKPRAAARGGVALDDLLAIVGQAEPHGPMEQFGGGQRAYVHAGGDWQLGKMDLDGPAGTVARITASIPRSLERMRMLGEFEHAHIAFLGDCVEGFVSQGGANTWRTTLTLTEQIRLVRRLMLAHVIAFAPLVNKLTVVSVPGNHDEAVRLGGKMGTRADDSFAVEALHAVADACAQNPEAFGHVEFFTPKVDSLTVTTEVAGTIITHAHGHQYRDGKHFEWLDGMAGNRQPEGEADILLGAHKHHLIIQERGPRTFIQAPAMEGESTWWRNRTGQGGAPGVITFTTTRGRIHDMEVLR